MATKKYIEIKNLSKDELVSKIREAESNVFKGRMQHITGQLTNPKSLWKMRKDLARMKMLMTQKSEKVSR